MKDYIVKTGSINDLKGVVELDKIVFGLSRTPEKIEDKLRLQKDVRITIVTITNGKLVGYGIGYEKRGKSVLQRKKAMLLSLLRPLTNGKKCLDCFLRRV